MNSVDRPGDPGSVPPHLARCFLLVQMVHELHRLGFQRLRLCPGMSPSGMYWRTSIAPISNVQKANGAMLADWEGPAAHYTSGDGGQFFGWKSVKTRSPKVIAEMFVQRFPEIAALGQGSDWAYAGWYLELLRLTDPFHLPIAYSEYFTARGHLSTVPDEVELPMPPPGLSRKRG